MANRIDPSLFYANRPNQQKKTGDGALGKDDFLKILITQLQNQDPTNPMDDREFIAQMAQFSSLEQMTNMNTTLEKFIQQQTDSKMFEYSHLIGKNVRVLTGYDDDDLPIYTIEKVVSVGQHNNQVALKLGNGEWVSEELVVEISDSKMTIEEKSANDGENKKES